MLLFWDLPATSQSGLQSMPMGYRPGGDRNTRDDPQIPPTNATPCLVKGLPSCQVIMNISYPEHESTPRNHNSERFFQPGCSSEKVNRQCGFRCVLEHGEDARETYNWTFGMAAQFPFKNIDRTNGLSVLEWPVEGAADMLQAQAANKWGGGAEGVAMDMHARRTNACQ